jgi:hypothetical protein
MAEIHATQQEIGRPVRPEIRLNPAALFIQVVFVGVNDLDIRLLVRLSHIVKSVWV